MNNLIWSFFPWVTFLLGARIGGVYWARDRARPRCCGACSSDRPYLHLFDVIGTVYFGGLLALLAVLHPADISTWGRCAPRPLPRLADTDRLRLHPDREALCRGLRPRADASAGMEQSTFSGLQSKDLSGLWPGLPCGHHVADRSGSVDSSQFVLRLVVPYGALLMALLYTQKHASQITEEVARVR